MTAPSKEVSQALAKILMVAERFPHTGLREPHRIISDHIATLEADRDNMALKNAQLALENGQLRFDADMYKQSADSWRNEVAALRRRVKSRDHLPNAGNMVNTETK